MSAFQEIAEKNGDEEMLESIEVFERQTSRMKGLIEQLLQMSVMDNENAVIAVEDVDLLDVVESVCDDVEYICKKNLKFTYDLKPTMVKANMNHIVIVVNNLMSNAVKYSNDGGSIHVSCGVKNDSYFISVRMRAGEWIRAQRKRYLRVFTEVSQTEVRRVLAWVCHR